MSSYPASLAPVYQQVKLTHNDEEEIALEDLERQESSTVLEEPTKAQSCREKCKARCFGNKDTPLSARLCRCFLSLMVLGFALWIVGGVAFTTYLGAKTIRCMNPHHTHAVQYSFGDDEIKEFDFGLVTGFVNVRTCPHAKNITVVVRKAAPTDDLIKTMVTKFDIKDGKATLVVNAPSFDWEHCQHTTVDLIVPEHLNNKVHLHVKAQVIFGAINVHAEKHTFGSVSGYANVGRVNLQDVHALETVHAETKFGWSTLNNIKTQAIVVKHELGFLCSKHVQAHHTADVSITTGMARMGFWSAPAMTVNSEVAWVSVWGLSKVPSFAARVDYGKLTVHADASFHGKFNVISPFGFIDVKHGKEVAKPTYTVKNTARIEGKFVSDKDSAALVPPSTLNAVSQYGMVEFYVENSHEPHHLRHGHHSHHAEHDNSHHPDAPQKHYRVHHGSFHEADKQRQG